MRSRRSDGCRSWWCGGRFGKEHRTKLHLKTRRLLLEFLHGRLRRSRNRLSRRAGRGRLSRRPHRRHRKNCSDLFRIIMNLRNSTALLPFGRSWRRHRWKRCRRRCERNRCGGWRSCGHGGLERLRFGNRRRGRHRRRLRRLGSGERGCNGLRGNRRGRRHSLGCRRKNRSSRRSRCRREPHSPKTHRRLGKLQFHVAGTGTTARFGLDHLADHFLLRFFVGEKNELARRNRSRDANHRALIENQNRFGGFRKRLPLV